MRLAQAHPNSYLHYYSVVFVMALLHSIPKCVGEVYWMFLFSPCVVQASTLVYTACESTLCYVENGAMLYMQRTVAKNGIAMH